MRLLRWRPPGHSLYEPHAVEATWALATTGALSVSTEQTMPLSMDEISLDGDVMSHIYKVFQRFDHDQDGRINAKELQRTLATVGMQLTHEMAGRCCARWTRYARVCSPTATT